MTKERNTKAVYIAAQRFTLRGVTYAGGGPAEIQVKFEDETEAAAFLAAGLVTKKESSNAIADRE